MLQKTRLRAIELLNGPNARAILILGVLIIAVLAGGAPNDSGG
jgi:hypothetical protein